VAVDEPSGLGVGLHDLRCHPEVDLARVAEPDPVAAAESLVRWKKDGDRVGAAVPGGPAAAGMAGAYSSR